MDQVARDCGLSPAHFRYRWRQNLACPRCPAYRLPYAAGRRVIKRHQPSHWPYCRNIRLPKPALFCRRFSQKFSMSPGDYRRQGPAGLTKDIAINSGSDSAASSPLSNSGRKRMNSELYLVCPYARSSKSTSPAALLNQLGPMSGKVLAKAPASVP